MFFYALFFLIFILPLQVAGSDLGDPEEAYLVHPWLAAKALTEAVFKSDASRVRVIMDRYPVDVLNRALGAAYGTEQNGEQLVSLVNLRQIALKRSRFDHRHTILNAFGLTMGVLASIALPELMPLHASVAVVTFIAWPAIEYERYARSRGAQEIVEILSAHQNTQNQAQMPVSAAVYRLFAR